ncbi:MAG: dihydrofolate reductase [Phycisphaerales bacterium]|jgi:dihydrofolate reductase|nr:dihydrofolate reductase [Phycisphaerales bacterium]
MEIVVAITDNFVIGRDGDMPWHLPADLQHFKNLTSGGTVVMGRKTWETLGKPLPNRTNVVITRQQDFVADGASVVHTLKEAIEQFGSSGVFIIGGGELYSQAIEFADKLHITRIHTTINGDTFFPNFDESNWSLSNSIDLPADDNNCYSMTFETWITVH